MGRTTGLRSAAPCPCWSRCAREGACEMEASATSAERFSRRDPTGGREAAGDVTFVPTPIADPGPLGLAASAPPTFVLSIFTADLVSAGGEPVVFGLAFAYGGLAQFAPGPWGVRTGTTFGGPGLPAH